MQRHVRYLEHGEDEDLVGEFLANLIHVDSHERHIGSTQLVGRLLYTSTRYFYTNLHNGDSKQSPNSEKRCT